MTKYFDVPIKFIQVSWEDLNAGETIYYTINGRDGLIGPFIVWRTENKTLINYAGRQIHTSAFPNPFTLWQMIV